MTSNPLDPELTWTCVRCHKPIADRTGYLQVTGYWKYPQLVQEWKQRHPVEPPVPPGRWFVRPATDYDDHPDLCRWRAVHDRCDRDTDPDYWFHIERIRTVGQLLEWTAHLMTKTWIQNTNWHDIVRSASQQVTGRQVVNA